MRRYKLVLADSAGNKLTLSSYSDSTKKNDPGALNIEFDVPLSTAAEASSKAFVRVWGIGINTMAQANRFNNGTIQLYIGMAPNGLPLSDPSGYGMAFTGKIFQCFSNWQDINQTLDIVAYPDMGSVDIVKNLVFTWNAGTSINQAIANTLNTAFPGYPVTFRINNNIVTTHTINGYYQTLQQWCDYIKSKTSALIGGSYLGVDIVLADGAFFVSDATVQASPKVLKVTEFIGQPTFIGYNQINVRTVARTDIRVGSYIKMPTVPNVTTTQQSYSQFKSTIGIQGTYYVTAVRHLGNFRQADANSWVSSIDAVVIPS